MYFVYFLSHLVFWNWVFCPDTYTDIFELVNIESFIMVSVWYCVQLVLAGAPVGALARYENNETGEHVCVRHNAVFALYISLSLIFLLFLLPYTSLLTVYDYFMSLCVASLGKCFLSPKNTHTHTHTHTHTYSLVVNNVMGGLL